LIVEAISIKIKEKSRQQCRDEATVSFQQATTHDLPIVTIHSPTQTVNIESDLSEIQPDNSQQLQPIYIGNSEDKLRRRNLSSRLYSTQSC